MPLFIFMHIETLFKKVKDDFMKSAQRDMGKWRCYSQRAKTMIARHIFMHYGAGKHSPGSEMR